MDFSRIAPAAFVIALAACSHTVDAGNSVAAPVVTAYAEKVPGKWALLVDPGHARGDAQSDGLRCGLIKYPLDLETSFALTAASTFRQVTQDIRVKDHPLTHAEIASGGYAGTIALHIEAVRARIDVSGVVDASASATSEIDGTLAVMSAGRRLVDTGDTGSGHALRDAGLTCAGAADAAAAATNDALQDLVRRLAEHFANSHSVRNTASGFAPTMAQ